MEASSLIRKGATVEFYRNEVGICLSWPGTKNHVQKFCPGFPVPNHQHRHLYSGGFSLWNLCLTFHSRLCRSLCNNIKNTKNKDEWNKTWSCIHKGWTVFFRASFLACWTSTIRLTCTFTSTYVSSMLELEHEFPKLQSKPTDAMGPPHVSIPQESTISLKSLYSSAHAFKQWLWNKCGQQTCVYIYI